VKNLYQRIEEANKNAKLSKEEQEHLFKLVSKGISQSMKEKLREALALPLQKWKNFLIFEYVRMDNHIAQFFSTNEDGQLRALVRNCILFNLKAHSSKIIVTKKVEVDYNKL
jgi:hypothetical protein